MEFAKFHLTVWIKVTSANEEWLEGTPEPMLVQPGSFDGQNLAEGTVIRLKRSHVFRVRFADPKKYAGLEPVRQFWDRGCFVEERMLEEKAPVQYLYREVSDLPLREDDLPDSGWRLRKSPRPCGGIYVPLGAVLNHDDSWRHLVDEPPGSVFEKNPETGLFQKLREGARLGSAR